MGGPYLLLDGNLVHFRLFTSAGRCLEVRRFESGNKTKTTSPRRQFIIGSHFRPIPILSKFELGARANPQPEIHQCVFHEDQSARRDVST